VFWNVIEVRVPLEEEGGILVSIITGEWEWARFGGELQFSFSGDTS